MTELVTPLYERHVELGGKIVPFAGYLLPVQYEAGLVKEHMAVRTACGLFDVSHMAEILIEGADAKIFVQNLVTVNVFEMEDGHVKYTPMTNHQGGIVDDILVYRVNENKFFLVVNAANHAKDVKWILDHATGSVTITDVSEQIGQLALQGPNAIPLMKSVIENDDLRPKKYYTFIWDAALFGKPCLISRTGYTGELGYEIYAKAEDIGFIFDRLLEAGQEFGILPCGLGARDTLRLEAAMPLYGHELRDDITPLEASLEFFVKLDKGDFIGRDAIMKKLPLSRKRVGLAVVGRGIIREQCEVFDGERHVGTVSSGTLCPYVNKAVGMALLDIDVTEPGTCLSVDVRGRRIPVEVVSLPFYKRPTTK